jgi:hypothetical protein
MTIVGALLIAAIIATVAVVVIDHVRRRVRREAFIRAYMFPPGVLEKMTAAHPGLPAKDLQLVARALRQYFLTFLKSGGQRVAMPSRVVDDLWHEFILFTRDYESFCRNAFGQFLHHTPAVKMGAGKPDNEGLRRVWWFACLEENINPRTATRLPLLFAIDGKLGIENGFVYDLGRRSGLVAGAAVTAAVLCAASFTDKSIDGTTDGLANGKKGSGCGGGGADGSSGCSGGCGGGCGGGS